MVKSSSHCLAEPGDEGLVPLDRDTRTILRSRDVVLSTGRLWRLQRSGGLQAWNVAHCTDSETSDPAWAHLLKIQRRARRVVLDGDDGGTCPWRMKTGGEKFSLTVLGTVTVDPAQAHSPGDSLSAATWFLPPTHH